MLKKMKEIETKKSEGGERERVTWILINLFFLLICHLYNPAAMSSFRHRNVVIG